MDAYLPSEACGFGPGKVVRREKSATIRAIITRKIAAITRNTFFERLIKHKKAPFGAFELFHFLHDGVESFRMIHCQVCENLTVKIDTGFLQLTHEFRVRHIVLSYACIDTGDPK